MLRNFRMVSKKCDPNVNRNPEKPMYGFHVILQLIMADQRFQQNILAVCAHNTVGVSHVTYGQVVCPQDFNCVMCGHKTGRVMLRNFRKSEWSAKCDPNI